MAYLIGPASLQASEEVKFLFVGRKPLADLEQRAKCPLFKRLYGLPWGQYTVVRSHSGGSDSDTCKK